MRRLSTRLSRHGASAAQAHLQATVGPRRRTTLTLALALLCTTLTALAIVAAPASAVFTFPQIGQISGPAPGSSFATLNSESIAVNDKNGHILVADSGKDLVYDFASASDTSPSVWDGSNTPSGFFGSLVSVAVDNSTGDVYVADNSHLLIDKFDAAGNRIASFGVAGQLSGAGTPADFFTPSDQRAWGIAVDQSSRDLYVLDSGHKVVDVFDSAGNFLPAKQITSAPGGLYPGCGGQPVGANTDGLAVNAATGHVYVAVTCFGTAIFEFDAAGDYVQTLDGSGTPAGSFGGRSTSAAVDNGSGDLYVADPGDQVVDRLDSSGNYQAQIVGASGGFTSAVAVDQATGDVYVADARTVSVKVYSGTPTYLADISTNPVSNLLAKSATISGRVAPDPSGGGNVSECHFEYGTDNTYNLGSLPCAEGNSFSSPTDVHADLSGLSPVTTYHFRLVASNANGPYASADQTFSTPPAVTLSTNPASNVTVTSATLNASVDPAGNGDIADCHFQIIDDTAFSNNGGNYSSGATDVPCDQPTPIPSGTDVTATTDVLSGTTYDFRIVATDPAGTTVGSNRTFTTVSHFFATTFAGSGDNALSGPTDVAVDQASHDVYVTDPGHFRIEKFDSAGNFILMFGKGVNQTTGADVCTAASGDTCQPGAQAAASGAPIGAFDVPTYLAVDNSSGPSSGDVYVGDTATELIQKFAPDGALVTSWGDSHANAPAPNGQLDASSDKPFSATPITDIGGVDVGTTGKLFLHVFYQSADQQWRVLAFDQSGGFLSDFVTLFAELPGATAVDSADNVYLPAGFSGSVIRAFTSTGDRLLLANGNLNEKTTNAAVTGIAVNPASDDVYVDDGGTVIDRFPAQCGNTCATITDSFGSPQLSAAQGLSVDPSSDNVYVADTGAGDVAVFTGVRPVTITGPASSVGHTAATLTGHLDPAGRGDVTDCHFEYVTAAAFKSGGYSDLSSGGSLPCAEGTTFSSASDVHVDLTGLAAETTYHYRLLAANAAGASVGVDRTVTPPAVFGIGTDPATDINTSSATLNGSYTGEGIDTTYRFAYGKTSSYGHLTASLDAGSASGPQSLSAAISNLVPGTTYHYAFLATNSFGTTVGPDRSFTTPQPPTIDSFSSSNVTADSADLHAQINPQGYDTTYHFEYGTTTGYGQSAPLSEADAGSSSSDQSVVVHIGGLQGTIYHFRLLATSKWGTTTSADQTFEFFPPGCPNAAVRQQTGAAYLPDCRAYELVSPGEANGTILYPGGPNSGTATNPSRLSFTGAFSSLPGATQTVGTSGDLYVATRTDSGWVSKYVGLPGNQTGCVSGPPNHPWSNGKAADKIANFILTDPAMDRFLNWDDGSSGTCFANGNGTGDANTYLDQPSNAPYLWSADGSPIAHLPTSFASTSGAAAAFTCPNVGNDGLPSLQAPIPRCTSDVTASGDLTHLAFSSNSLAFTPGGLTTTPPGSAYDNDLASGAVSLISVLPGGGDIPQDPAYAASLAQYNATHYAPNVGEFIRFPAVSTGGSHILMSTATAVTPEQTCFNTPCPRFTDIPLHLYMRVNDALSYDVSEGHAVNYVGMTPDGSKVYFTSDQQLTPDDTDTSTDLYMWSEATDSLTRLSAAGNGAPDGAGNSDSCAASWTAGCGVVSYSGWSFASSSDGGYGGNGVSDSAIASQNGDIYFYSPEQLDGDHGVAGQQNLYVYRGGLAHFVTTLDPGPFCQSQSSLLDTPACADGPVVRLEVNPDDTRAAFVTAVRLTSYDNAGHLEMYSYDPATGAIVCASCRPDGDPPTSDVVASQDGRFLTNDGRAFFATEESLVPQDTNQGQDVYEFVDGRPQLITLGTGTATTRGENFLTRTERPGLDGVSADGADAYFSTFDRLVPEDHNGNFMKFYDARTNGGFPEPPPAPPCAAAEECHGPGSLSPATSQITSNGAPATGGNATPRPHPRHHRKKHHHKRHTRTANANRGGGR